MSPITRSSAKRVRSEGDDSETNEDANIDRSKRHRRRSTSSDQGTASESEEGNSDHSFSRRRHMHNLERTCNICKRVFKRIAHLRDHLAVHDPNRPKYRCSHPNCNREYNEVKNWRAHFLKHHTIGPKCQKMNKLKQFERKLKKVNNNE